MHRIAGTSKIDTQLEGLIDRQVPEQMREGAERKTTGGPARGMSPITMARRLGEGIVMVTVDLVEGGESTTITVGEGREVTTMAVEEGTIMAVEEGTSMAVDGGTTTNGVGETTIIGGGREVMIMAVMVVGGRGMTSMAGGEGREMTTTVVEEEGTIMAAGEGGTEMTTEVAGGGRGTMTILRVEGEGNTMIVGEEGIMMIVGGEEIGREKGVGGDRKLIEREIQRSGGVREIEMGRGTLEPPCLPEVEGMTIRVSEGGTTTGIAGAGMIAEEAGERETGRDPGVGGDGSHPLVRRVMTRKWMRKGLNW